MSADPFPGTVLAASNEMATLARLTASVLSYVSISIYIQGLRFSYRFPSTKTIPMAALRVLAICSLARNGKGVARSMKSDKAPVIANASVVGKFRSHPLDG